MKLGIVEGLNICVVNAPSDYLEMTACPFQVQWDRRPDHGLYSFLHLFAKDLEELVTCFPKMKERMSKSGMFWVAWPKKAGSISSELDGNVIREYGLSQGLVDVKVASIDNNWSALKFVYRLRDRN